MRYFTFKINTVNNEGQFATKRIKVMAASVKEAWKCAALTLAELEYEYASGQVVGIEMEVKVKTEIQYL